MLLCESHIFDAVSFHEFNRCFNYSQIYREEVDIIDSIPSYPSSIRENFSDVSHHFPHSGPPSQVDTVHESPVLRGPLPLATPKFYPRKGWIYDNGSERQIAGYRHSAGGCQVLIYNGLDYELLPTHRHGGEAAIDAYQELMEEEGIEPYIFTESSINHLRNTPEDQISLVSVCTIRHSRKLYLQLAFTGEESLYWYSISTVKRYHSRWLRQHYDY